MWAEYWYDSVHKSTGFGTPITATSAETSSGMTTLSPLQLAAYRECLPFYELLRRHAIGVHPLNPGSSSTELFLPGQSSSPRNPLALLADTRNADILAWVGDRLRPRESAKVSVFDSAVQGGDAVWEGLRVYNGFIFKLEEHLQRLFDSAKALDFQGVPPKEYIIKAIVCTLTGQVTLSIHT